MTPRGRTINVEQAFVEDLLRQLDIMRVYETNGPRHVQERAWNRALAAIRSYLLARYPK